jgi:hypothetical protein
MQHLTNWDLFILDLFTSNYLTNNNGANNMSETEKQIFPKYYYAVIRWNKTVIGTFETRAEAYYFMLDNYSTFAELGIKAIRTYNY